MRVLLHIEKGGSHVRELWRGATCPVTDARGSVSLWRLLTRVLAVWLGCPSMASVVYRFAL